MGSTHVLAIPFPGQGHVIPLLEFSQYLVQNGFRITFVNTEFNHKRVINALKDQTADRKSIGDKIRLVSIPDGMEPWENRNEIDKLCEAMRRVVPGKLEEIINKINATEEEKITCVIADIGMWWGFEVADKMNIRSVAFWTASAAMLCSSFSIPKLIDDGLIDSNGTPVKQILQLSPTMPIMNTAHFVWCCIGDFESQKIIFSFILSYIEAVKLADCIICNSVYEFETGAFDFCPQIQPIGPLLSSNRRGNSAGSFWDEDFSCLQWLDQQEPNSVIYVAFGSITIFGQTQFQELALGLELSNKPFLWVVRPDITDQLGESYPEGFQQRVADRGRIIGWAPQQKVLSHPSVGCFLSHCGWNSTMEGLCNGVTFLCWPYFVDQFLNESYICDVWKVGLKFDGDERGIITRHEIKNKIEQVMKDKNFKVRSLELKEKAMSSVAEGGNSSKNLKNLVERMKEV